MSAMVRKQHVWENLDGIRHRLGPFAPSLYKVDSSLSRNPALMGRQFRFKIAELHGCR